MLKYKLLKIPIILVLLISISFLTLAKEDEKYETDNRIKANSPFYFIHKFGESLETLFASKEDKAKLKLVHARERMVEAKEMWEAEEKDRAKELFKEGLNNLTEGLKLAKDDFLEREDVKEIRDDISILIKEINQFIIKNGDYINKLGEYLKNNF